MEGGRRLYNTKAAGPYVGLSPRTLEKKRVDGTGPRYIEHGGSRSGLVHYEQADLDAWLEAQKRRSTSDPGKV